MLGVGEKYIRTDTHVKNYEDRERIHSFLGTEGKVSENKRKQKQNEKALSLAKSV